MKSAELKLDFNYVARLFDVVLQDNKDLNLESESAREKIVDELLGRMATYLILTKN